MCSVFFLPKSCKSPSRKYCWIRCGFTAIANSWAMHVMTAGGCNKWGYLHSWMLYKGKSHWNGWFRGIPILGQGNHLLGCSYASNRHRICKASSWTWSAQVVCRWLRGWDPQVLGGLLVEDTEIQYVHTLKT